MRGFTLIEMLLAMAVLAVLAAIALPSYRAHVQRSHRLDAVTALLQVQQAQERWRAQHSSFAADLDALGIPGARSERYRLAIQRSADNGFEVVAVAIAGQTADAECTSLSLTQQAGNTLYGSTGTAASRRCWNR